MNQIDAGRRRLLLGVTAAAAFSPLQAALAAAGGHDVPALSSHSFTAKDHDMTSITFNKIAPPDWLLAFWKEIDDKTWGKGFDCFADNAVAHLGVSDWHGREAIRAGLREFVDRNLTAHHDVIEYWDSPTLKVFRGFVTMVFNDKSIPTVRPTMQHFFYMDPADPSKVIAWYGSVGPTAF